MQVWELSIAAWLDRPGAWLPTGIDVAVLAGRPVLNLGACQATAWGGVGAWAAGAKLVLGCSGATASAGPAVQTGTIPLRLRPVAVAVARDALVLCPGERRLILVAHPSASRYEGWRVLRTGPSDVAAFVAGSSRPTARFAAVSSLAADDGDMTQ